MCKKSFQITAWALKKKKSTNKKLTQTPTLCFSFCFSLFNLILIENLVHWQMMECPAWEGQWIASVFAGILRLFTLHCLSCCCTRTDCKETHTKPTLCKGFFFSSVKENYFFKTRNMGSLKIFSVVSLHKLHTSHPGTWLEYDLFKLPGAWTVMINASIYFFFKIHCAIRLMRVPQHLCHYSWVDLAKESAPNWFISASNPSKTVYKHLVQMYRRFPALMI